MAKKKKQELLEELDEMGQEDEKKAAHAVKEVLSQRDAEHRKAEDEEKNKLHDVRGNRFAYNERIKRVLFANMHLVDWPRGYSFEAHATDSGVYAKFYTPDRKEYSKGIEVIQDEEWDYAAVTILVQQIENTVDHLEKRGNYGREGSSSGTGILLPKNTTGTGKIII